MNEVAICEFDNRYAGDFKQLNIDWIEQYFKVEEHDLEQLSNPEEYILSKGGYILLALTDGKVAGVCALIKTGDTEFELAKMAVDRNMRGRHIGETLGLAIIEKAKQVGATRVWLESNRILTPAINLYIKLGFKEIALGYSPYARADIRMEKVL